MGRIDVGAWICLDDIDIVLKTTIYPNLNGFILFCLDVHLVFISMYKVVVLRIGKKYL